MKQKIKSQISLTLSFFIIIFILFSTVALLAGDLPEIKKQGVLRHVGIVYANFVTGSGDGMDVELLQLFANYIGVEYKFVKSSWSNVIGDLTGKKVKPKGNGIKVLGRVPIKGDIIACGLTILPWREKIVNFSIPTFPTQVWLIAKADSPIKPIVPTGDVLKDIAKVKALLKGHTVLGLENTCLDPSLYGLEKAGAKIKFFKKDLNLLSFAVIKGEAETTLLDAPDAMIDLIKWGGKIKVIGPVSKKQKMACAFSKNSPILKETFNTFLKKSKKDGTYIRIVKKYYPAVFNYFPDFFKNKD